MSPKSKKKRNNQLEKQDDNMDLSYNDDFPEETKKFLKMLQVASQEEDIIDNEKMDFRSNIPNSEVITKRKRKACETFKHVKIEAKIIANRERNRKEMGLKRKEKRNNFDKAKDENETEGPSEKLTTEKSTKIENEKNT